MKAGCGVGFNMAVFPKHVRAGERGVTAQVDFEDWYRAEYRRLLASMLVLTGDLHAASDVTDEAFTRAFAHWNRVGVMDSPEAGTISGQA